MMMHAPEPFLGFDGLVAALEVRVVRVNPDQCDRSIALAVFLGHAEMFKKGISILGNGNSSHVRICQMTSEVVIIIQHFDDSQECAEKNFPQSNLVSFPGNDNYWSPVKNVEA